MGHRVSAPGELNLENTRVKSLGEAKFDTPIPHSNFTPAERRILFYPFLDSELSDNLEKEEVSLEVAGLRSKIFFEPQKVKAGIVTCGGICPGLNNVIRAITLTLSYNYGVSKIWGFRFGLQGMIPENGLEPIQLTPEKVTGIHDWGGTILGTSRGEQDISKIVDNLSKNNFNQLYIIGGDGSLRAAHAIQTEIEKRGLKIAVIGIPKTIDNDISYVSESFGFNTAVEIATNAIRCANVEATSNPNGIGLVKLMGRNSGFIAATAAVSQRDVNFVLIPEKKFELDGPKGFLSTLHKRIREKGHALIVVAEGAGQEFFTDEKKIDEYGHTRFKDIGIYLKERINDYFRKNNHTVNLKYIDPSYLIRSVPPNTYDKLFAATLGKNAVHAGMAGRTDMLVSIWHGVYCHVPFEPVSKKSKFVREEGLLWQNVLSSTGQPDFINEPAA